MLTSRVTPDQEHVPGGRPSKRPSGNLSTRQASVPAPGAPGTRLGKAPAAGTAERRRWPGTGTAAPAVCRCQDCPDTKPAPTGTPAAPPLQHRLTKAQTHLSFLQLSVYGQALKITIYLRGIMLAFYKGRYLYKVLSLLLLLFLSCILASLRPQRHCDPFF